MSGKIKVFLIVIGVLVVTTAISFFSVVSWAGKSDKIFSGVTVKGQNLGGQTKAEAENALKAYVAAMADKSIQVQFEGGEGAFKLSQVDYKSETGPIIDKAWKVGRNGNVLSQWMERRRVAERGTEIPFNYSVSKEKFTALINDMTAKVRTAPKDAKFVLTPQETIQIVESTPGRSFDTEDAYQQLKNMIDEDQTAEIQLAMVEVAPKLTTEGARNLKVDGPIASFTTHFNVNQVNRTFNVKVAAAALDGQVIMPGKSFSFNDIVGPRSSEAGYKDAKVIINNEFVDSLGGGVCQVSTTLYNALLQADVKITERSNHSLVVKYVPLGQDAAVAYGYKDLKFTNNLPCAVIMKSTISGGALTIKLFGDTSLKKTADVKNTIIKEYPFKTVYKDDPTLPKGKQVVSQNGENGYRVTSVLYLYKDGKQIAKKNLTASYYKALDKVILVGTGSSGAKNSSTKGSGTVQTTAPKTPAEQNQGGSQGQQNSSGENNGVTNNNTPDPGLPGDTTNNAEGDNSQSTDGQDTAPDSWPEGVTN